MKIDVLQTLYRILRSSTVNSCELSRADTVVRMRIGRHPSALCAAPAAAQAPEAAAPAQLPEGMSIQADTVGVFYTHAGALEKPLAKTGEIVKKGQTVGHIVSMGISHNLVSSVEGRIVSQRVRHKEPVEYGEVIFEVERE